MLARRTRALFLNSQAAIEAAPIVAKLMAQELAYDEKWQEAQLSTFKLTASNFCL